jgi:hypothetical protein
VRAGPAILAAMTRVRVDGRWVVAAVFVLTVAQLALATALPGVERFAGKGFAARLFAYPAMMLAVPFAWWLVTRRRPGAHAVPWAAFGWIMLPFLVDVTGNSLDLYDTVWWWDDANHLVNWFVLSLGLGLLLEGASRGAPWERFVLVGCLGAVLAIGWELGEYLTFIRHGTELDTAYTDTLGDEALGTLGALGAGALLARRAAYASSGSGRP